MYYLNGPSPLNMETLDSTPTVPTSQTVVTRSPKPSFSSPGVSKIYTSSQCAPLVSLPPFTPRSSGKLSPIIEQYEDTFLFSSRSHNLTHSSFDTDSSPDSTHSSRKTDFSSPVLDLLLAKLSTTKCSIPTLHQISDFNNIDSLCQSFGEISFHMNALSNATEIIPSSAFAPSLTDPRPTFVLQPSINNNRLTSQSNDTADPSQGGHSTTPNADLPGPVSLDRLALMFESNVAEIASLKTAVSHLKAKNELLEEKFCSDLKDINDQVDNVFAYFDARMDLMFMGKAKEIDAHFTTTFEQMTQMENSMRDLIHSCVDKELSKASIVSKMLPVVRNEIIKALSESELLEANASIGEILPLVRDEINKILDEKEVTID